MMRLNNKGYVLLEIILASVIAMTIAYFVMDLTVKLKNKNDDLLVRTQVATDQAIIYNTIMKEIYNGTFSCNSLVVDEENKKFTYRDFVNVLSSYVTDFSLSSCDVNSGKYIVKIDIGVKQLSEDNFDVDICYGTGCY